MRLNEREIRRLVRDILVEKIELRRTTGTIVSQACEELWLLASNIPDPIARRIPGMSKQYTERYKEVTASLTSGQDETGATLSTEDKAKLEKEKLKLEKIAKAVAINYTGLGYTKTQCNEINCANGVNCQRGISTGKLATWFLKGLNESAEKIRSDKSIHDEVHSYIVMFYPRVAKTYSSMLKSSDDPAVHPTAFKTDIDNDNNAAGTEPWKYKPLANFISHIESFDTSDSNEAKIGDNINTYMSDNYQEWTSPATGRLSQKSSADETQNALNRFKLEVKDESIFKESLKTFSKAIIETSGGATKNADTLKSEFTDNH